MSVIPKHNFKADDLIKEGKTTRSNIEEIRKWLAFKLYIPQLSDEQIVLFLIACNNDLEQTKNTIEKHFKIKSSSPELFLNRDIDTKDNQFTYKVSNIAIAAKRTKDNYLVGMGSLKDTTYYNFCIEPQIKAAFTAIESYLYTNPPDGLVFIIDIKGVGLMHLTRLKLGPLKTFFAYLQEGLPSQLKQVHVLNGNYIFEKFMTMAKPFMKKELFEMINVHPPEMNMEDFFEKYIPASCMSSTYGGDLPPIEELCENTRNHLRKLKHFLETEEKQIQLYKK